MEPSRDADHLAVYSEAMYPVGPDVDGEISYVHLPPLSPLNVTVIAIACIAFAAFLCCYFYPIVQRRHDARTAATHRVKRPVLASARSLFGLRPREPPTTPQLLARYGRLDMRIARPPPALSRFRGSSHSPELSPSLSSSCSSSPSSIGTPPLYSPFTLPEVIVTPVDMGILGQAVESRTTPKKGGDHYDSGEQEDE
ncbi:hypothetical protein BJV78DRAFT_1283054 [Lactifluus subvellereus]|nr:hypothetical protein BJV78DRAFT_1283054 [Lactifluus subvellereus]